MFNMTQLLSHVGSGLGIVNISSVNGSKGAFGQANYAAGGATDTP